MLFRELSGDPYDCDCLKAGRISKQLAKVRMIRTFDLIFDQDPMLIRISAKNVGTEWSNWLFCGLQFKFNAKGLAEQLEIFLAGKPWSEVCSLIGKDCAEFNVIECS